MNPSMRAACGALLLLVAACDDGEEPYEAPSPDTNPPVVLAVPEVARFEFREFDKGALEREHIGKPYGIVGSLERSEIQFGAASAETFVTVVGGEDGPVRTIDLTSPKETVLHGYGNFAGSEEVHRRQPYVDSSGVHGTRVGVYRNDGGHGHTNAWYYVMARSDIQNYVTELEEWDWQSGNADLSRFQTSAWPFVPSLVKTRFPYYTIASITPAAFDRSGPMEVEFERTDAVAPAAQVPDCVRVRVTPDSASVPAHLVYLHEGLGLVEIVLDWEIDSSALPGHEIVARDGFSISKPKALPPRDERTYPHANQGYWAGIFEDESGQPRVAQNGKPWITTLALRPGTDLRPHSGTLTVTGDYFHAGVGKVAVAGIVFSNACMLLTEVEHTESLWVRACLGDEGLVGEHAWAELEGPDVAADPLHPRTTYSTEDQWTLQEGDADAVSQLASFGTLPEGPGVSCQLAQAHTCDGESCCTSVYSPGGQVRLGAGDESSADYSPGASSEEAPEHPEHVGEYYLDKYPVTVGRFQAFLNAWHQGWRPSWGDGSHPKIENTGWQTWALEMKAEDCADNWSSDEPSEVVGCANWYDAFAFCIWDGGRLPTEAEWELAAAGGSENRLHPWGDEALPLESRWQGEGELTFPLVGRDPSRAGRYGHQDLVGVSWEWTLDAFAPGSYASRIGCSDCATLEPTDEAKIVRGGTGDVASEAFRLEHSARFVLGLDSEPGRSAYRAAVTAYMDEELVSFRCARDVAPQIAGGAQ